MENLKLKFPPIIQVIFFAIIIALLDKVYPVTAIPLNYSAWVALFLVVIGAFIVLWGGLCFRKASTTVDPRYPSNTTALVIVGIYQHTRNPMYLGMLFSLLGIVVYFGSLSSVFVLPFFIWTMNEFQIQWEEKALLEKFGQPYQEYLDNVRRWI